MKVCLAFMTQNELHWLKVHFDSWARYPFDGVVAVDGGSTDGTQAWLRERGVLVFERPFEWDFADQGNFLISCCEGVGFDALVRLDPDELIFPGDIALVVSSLAKYPAVRVNRYNFVMDRLHYDNTTYPDDQTRAFRLNEGIHYERRVHEVISTPMDKRLWLKDVNLFHYGWCDNRETRTLRFLNYDRLMDDLEALTELPPGTPLWEYPACIPFSHAQPLDPCVIGIRAPFEVTMTDQTLQSAADKIADYRSWYQRIEVAPGLLTPGVQDSKGLLAVLDRLGLPQDMSGLRVLDVGAGDGFYAFACEQRGAEVVAVDVNDQRGFEIAAELLGSKLKVTQETVYALTAEKYGTFDVILCLGLIYHLRHPLLALDVLRQLAKPAALLFLEAHMIDECLITDIETAKTAPLRAQKDAGLWQVVERLGDDTTLTWMPSVAGLEALLRKAAWQSSNHFGTARGIVAAVAAEDEHALYAAYRETVGVGKLYWQSKKAQKFEPPHPRRKFAQGYMPPLVKQVANGIEFTIRTGAYHAVDKGVIFEVQEEYGQGVIDYGKIEKVIDIGGHIGSWTKYVKHHAPNAECVIVEPDDMNFEMLNLNLDGLDGVRRIHGAVAYDTGKFYLAADHRNSGGHILVGERDRASAERDPNRYVFEVPTVVTLEQLCEQWTDGDIDVLKLDCESGEYAILMNADENLLKRFKYVVGEYHSREPYFEEHGCARLRQWFDVSLKPHPSGDPRGIFFAVRKPNVSNLP